MKILVCVKVIKGEINPFDESALECALRLSDDVTIVSMGPESSVNPLKALTRLGAKVILLSDKIYAGSDTLATSYILSEAIKNMEYDLIICGRQSVDGDTAQVGPMLSYRLGCNLITNALTVECKDNVICANTRIGEMSVEIPALVTIEKGYILRFPSIFSKVGDVKVYNNTDIKCDALKCGLSGSPTKVMETFENERGRRKCKFISYDELEPLIADLLNAEFEVKPESTSSRKLKSVWCVGDEVVAKAKEIAEEVEVISKDSPFDIAHKAQKEKPDVILWNADLWGRSNAPIVAAILETGLCADCTELETDGENFIMYRPAQGGNITAKIQCVTTPKMATVRTKTESADIVVSGGKGVEGKIDKLKSFAERIGAQIGASRGLVDLGALDYEKQIGLTGKTVSPKIYIAIGISGAIHHTCAIENSGTVIAINPDKNARIFEYADYGVLDEF